MEEWRPVVGWEGMYEVSDLGRVRSVDRWVNGKPGHRARKRGRMLVFDVSKKHPHLRARLSRNRRSSWHFVHTLVLEAFVGPRPPGAVARHGLGGPQDNRPSNLQWGTISQNVRDEVAHGTHIHSRKIRCRRGHLLQPFNNYPKIPVPGRRMCRACNLARACGHAIGSPEFLAKSDQVYYELVMAR